MNNNMNNNMVVPIGYSVEYDEIETLYYLEITENIKFPYWLVTYQDNLRKPELPKIKSKNKF
jgi:hypothetical protein